MASSRRASRSFSATSGMRDLSAAARPRKNRMSGCPGFASASGRSTARASANRPSRTQGLGLRQTGQDCLSAGRRRGRVRLPRSRPGRGSRRKAATARARRRRPVVMSTALMGDRAAKKKEGGRTCHPLPEVRTYRIRVLRGDPGPGTGYYFVAANAPEIVAISPSPIWASNSPVAAIGWSVSSSSP